MNMNNFGNQDSRIKLNNIFEILLVKQGKRAYLQVESDRIN